MRRRPIRLAGSRARSAALTTTALLTLLGGLLLMHSGNTTADAEAAAGAAEAAPCRVQVYEVGFGVDGASDGHLVAEVCVPRSPKGVQVLLHGSTMRRSYWNFSGPDDRYSYVRAAHERGWATVAIDRLGAGSSSRPPAAEVDNASSAETVHQVLDEVVRALERRTGRGLHVVVVGHSQGSSVAIRLAAAFPDEVDGLVTTGFLHHSGPAADLFLPSLHPAAQDPALPNGSMPEGYLTTKPGLRVLGYDAFHVDRRIVARDEATKSTTTMAEVVDFAVEQRTHLFSTRVTQPVLTLVGANDLLFCRPGACDDVVRAERAAFPAAVSVTGRVVPDAGHNLALQRNARRSARSILNWADSL